MYIWASPRQNLSNGFPTKRVSNQSPQLQRLARKLISPVASLHMILSKMRITKALIRLCGCAGWSAPVLLSKPWRHVFSRQGPYMPSLSSETRQLLFLLRLQASREEWVLENYFLYFSSKTYVVGTQFNSPFVYLNQLQMVNFCHTVFNNVQNSMLPKLQFQIWQSKLKFDCLATKTS